MFTLLTSLWCLADCIRQVCIIKHVVSKNDSQPDPKVTKKVLNWPHLAFARTITTLSKVLQTRQLFYRHKNMPNSHGQNNVRRLFNIFTVLYHPLLLSLNLILMRCLFSILMPCWHAICLLHIGMRSIT